MSNVAQSALPPPVHDSRTTTWDGEIQSRMFLKKTPEESDDEILLPGFKPLFNIPGGNKSPLSHLFAPCGTVISVRECED